MSAQKSRLRLVVYTVLVGEKEALNNPLAWTGAGAASDLDIDYVCFTDNVSLSSPTWRMQAFLEPLIPAEKRSRLPKARPDLFFADYDYSLYIDNTVVFKRLPQRADVEGALFRGFRHPWRSNPQDEADIVVKAGLDGADVVAAQSNFYRSAGAPLDGVGRLSAGTVLLRCHHDVRVKRFGELWWQQILLFSKRDQLTLDLCAREAGCPLEYFPGDKTSNELFVWPVLAGGRRVQGSFDAERYAWEHRADPVARQQPRTHFLEHGSESERYTRRVSWFAYACECAGSSLGEQIAPRRGIADVVERALQRLGATPGRILIAGMLCDAPWAVASEELSAAQAAIARYYRFAVQPEVITAAVAEGELLEPAPFQGAAGVNGFALLIVLGLSPAHAELILPKLRPLLGEHGQVLLQFGGSLDVASMGHLHASAPAGSGVEVFHGRHISVDGVIPGSVFIVSF